MSKHTPGPWFTNTPFEGHVATLNGRLICSAMGSYDGKEGTRAENLANARLIAAAPDLLVALQGLLDSYVSLVNSGDAGYWNPETETEVQAARAAIAKAEGKESNG